MHVAFGVFLLGYFCVLLGCFFAYAAELRYYEPVFVSGVLRSENPIKGNLRLENQNYGRIDEKSGSTSLSDNFYFSSVII